MSAFFDTNELLLCQVLIRRNRQKKLTAFVAALFLMLSASGCGAGGETSNTATPKATESPAVTASPTWVWEQSPVSTYGPNAKAAKVYEGKLPVNTIIAPTSPVNVLPGGGFGWRDAPDQDGRELHNGTDVSVGEGRPVVSAMDGVVEDVMWDVWGGNRVEVVHEDGMMSTYNHLKDVQVKERDELKASQQLGTVGQTGTRVTGPHLHFEMWVKGEVVDPRTFDWKKGSEIIPALRKSQPQDEIPIEKRAPSDPAKPCPVGESQADNCTPLDVEEDLCPPTDSRRGDCLPPEVLPSSFPPLEECESLGQGRFNCDPFDLFPGPEDCPPAAVEDARTDCPTVRSDPSAPEVPSDPNTSEVPSEPNTSEVPSDPNTSEVPSDPNTSEVPSDPNTSEVPSGVGTAALSGDSLT
jgi:murein DD-endopeptidase MepM/ murein hydrolase activator NlpD